MADGTECGEFHGDYFSFDASDVRIGGGLFVGGLMVDPVAGTIGLAEIAAPSTPPANSLWLYAKDQSGKSALFCKNDSGQELGVISCRQGVRRVERKLGSQTQTMSSGADAHYDVTIVWDNAFTSIIGMASDCYTNVEDVGLKYDETRSISTTGATKAAKVHRSNTSGDSTLYVDFWGIGT